MPVWERNCPKCGRPLKVDTQSSKLYCSYCNTQFWTDEFLHNRTKYHKSQKSKKSDWFSSSFSSDKNNKSKQTDGKELGLLIAGIIIVLPFAILFALFVH